MPMVESEQELGKARSAIDQARRYMMIAYEAVHTDVSGYILNLLKELSNVKTPDYRIDKEKQVTLKNITDLEKFAPEFDSSGIFLQLFGNEQFRINLSTAETHTNALIENSDRSRRLFISLSNKEVLVEAKDGKKIDFLEGKKDLEKAEFVVNTFQWLGRVVKEKSPHLRKVE